VQKNRIIKPKIRWKAKKSPDVWQGQYQALEVQQALIGFTSPVYMFFSPEGFALPGFLYWGKFPFIGSYMV